LFSGCSKEGRFQLVTANYYDQSKQEMFKIDTKTGSAWYLVGGTLQAGGTIAVPMQWVQIGDWKPSASSGEFSGLKQAAPPPP
jgi:hypothetical protein